MTPFHDSKLDVTLRKPGCMLNPSTVSFQWRSCWSSRKGQDILSRVRPCVVHMTRMKMNFPMIKGEFGECLWSSVSKTSILQPKLRMVAKFKSPFTEARHSLAQLNACNARNAYLEFACPYRHAIIGIDCASGVTQYIDMSTCSPPSSHPKYRVFGSSTWCSMHCAAIPRH